MNRPLRSLTIFALIVSLCSISNADRPRGRRPEQPPVTENNFIEISPETTVVTEYLDANGFPDYVAAMNAMKSKGISPEENAEAKLWLAIGKRPEHEDEAYTLAMAQALGIEDEYLKSTHRLVEGYAHLNELMEQEFGDQMSKVRRDKTVQLQKKLEQSQFKPWTKAEFPEGFELLQRNAKTLELTHAAVQLPKYYRPIAFPPDQEEAKILISVLLPDVQSYRELTRLLCSRAMLHAGEGRYEEAQRDLIASHKLARLVPQGFSLIELLVGIALESMTLNADAAICLDGKMPVEQLQKFRAELAKLPPAFTTEDFIRSIDEGERYCSLDAVLAMAKGELSLEELGAGFPDGEDNKRDWRQLFLKNAFDWNEVLIVLNEYYDQIIADAKLDRPQRAEANQKFIERFEKTRSQFQGWEGIAKSILQGSKGRGKLLGDIFAALLVPAISLAQDACERVVMKKELVDVTIALAIYKTETGKLPETLAQLVPAHLPKVPIDKFNNQPLQYRSTADGTEMILYSAGPNGEDNGGYERGQLVGIETDDIAIRSFDLKENEQLQLLGK